MVQVPGEKDLSVKLGAVNMQAKQSSLCVGKWKPHLTQIQNNFIIILIALSFLLLLSHIQCHTHAQDADSTVFGVDLFAFNEAISSGAMVATKSVIVHRMKILFTDSENSFLL